MNLWQMLSLLSALAVLAVSVLYLVRCDRMLAREERKTRSFSELMIECSLPVGNRQKNLTRAGLEKRYQTDLLALWNGAENEEAEWLFCHLLLNNICVVCLDTPEKKRRPGHAAGLRALALEYRKICTPDYPEEAIRASLARLELTCTQEPLLAQMQSLLGELLQVRAGMLKEGAK